MLCVSTSRRSGQQPNSTPHTDARGAPRSINRHRRAPVSVNVRLHMTPSPNSAHSHLVGWPSALGVAAVTILLSGHYLLSLAAILAFWPSYALGYVAYFSQFDKPSEHRGATFGFVLIQLVFWGIVFLLVRIATLKSGAI